MRKFVFVLWLLFFEISLFSQTLRFEHPTDKTQFLRSTILDIIQDEHGFLWIATTDGLGRYDGKTVVEYRNIRGDSTSLSNNYTSQLWEGKEGRIWVATKSGLNCYLPQKDAFIQYYNYDAENFEGGNYILDVLEDKHGFVWFSTYEGVFRLDPTNDKILDFGDDPENDNSFSHKIAWSIFEDSKGRLWFGTNNGISYFDNDGSFQFKKILPEPQNLDGLKTERVFYFTEQPDGTLWFGTDYGFFKVIELEERIVLQQYKHDPSDPNSLSHNFIQNIWTEGNEKLWVSTWAGGLDEVFLPKKEGEDLQFIHHQHDSNDDRTISLNRVNKTIMDNTGTLWVATSAGLDKATESNWKFESINQVKNDKESLSHSVIKSILRDSKGNLWIGTYDGLNFLSAKNFQQKNYKFKKFQHDKNDPKSISHNNIFSLEEDSLGFLWIGTYRELNYVDLNADLDEPEFKKIKFKNGIPHTWIYHTLEIEKGNYWIATYGKMAKMIFDPRKDIAPRFEIHDMDSEAKDSLVNATTYEFCKDKFGDYWIGTFLGLSKYINENGKERFENYKNVFGDTTSLSDNSIVTLFKDSKGRLWVGTRNGLNLVVQKSWKEKATFKIFGTKEGFPSDLIRSIEEDGKGLLWIGTSKGLVHFDPDAAEIGKPSVLKIYNSDDGLMSRSMVFRASHKDQFGNLYFGTANGLNYFKPSQLVENQNVAPLVFTSLKVLNKKITPSNAPDAILKKSIGFTDTLILKHDQNVIELEFAALDFTNSLKNKYQHQLDGFKEEWIFQNDNNLITYTNLTDGDYTLRVKGSNNDGVWNETPTELFIRILPPWWKTWWAYLGYFLTFSALVYSFIHVRVQQRMNKLKSQAAIKAARFEEREILRKKNAADFHDELGHRLTKISLFLELAEREAKDNSTLKTFFSKIKSNTSGLSDGIRDLIWSLDPKKDTMYQTVTRLQEFGDRLFEFSEIKFKTLGIDKELEKIDLEPDVRKQVLMIFKEAMNNSLKYSEAENALLQTESQNGHISIIFKDDGKGFDIFQKKKGYGLKNMQDRAEKINGAISVISNKKIGTAIKLKLNNK